MRIKAALALILILIPLNNAFVCLGAGGGWLRIHDQAAQYMAVYDVDADGDAEVVCDRFIYDAGIAPTHPSIVFKAIFDGDEEADLVVYAPATGRVTIYGSQEGASFTIDPNLSAFRVFSSGFSIGNYIFGGGSYMYAPPGSAPIVIDGKLHALYVDARGLILSDGAKEECIFAVEAAEIVDAGLHLEHVYVALTLGASTVIVRYNLRTGVAFTSVHQLTPDRSMFNGGSFLFADHGVLYIASASGLKIAGYASKIFYPADKSSCFAAYTPPYAAVFSFSGESIEEKTRVVLDFAPAILDYDGGLWAASFEGGVYIYSAAPPPAVELIAPPAVTAGKPFTVLVQGSYKSVEVYAGWLRFTSSQSPASFNVSLPAPGNYTIVAKAYSAANIFTVVKRAVTAAPRDMSIIVEHPSSVEPYSTFTVAVKVYDAETAQEVRDLKCTIMLASTGEVSQAAPFANVTLRAIPLGMEVPIVISCYGVLYGSKSASIVIPISKPYLNVTLQYTGGGEFIIEAYNTYTKEPFTGTISVSVDNEKARVFSRRGFIKVSEGKHVLDVSLYFGGALCLRKQYAVEYYPDASLAPKGEKIIVADRVVQQPCPSANATSPTPQPKPVLVEVERLSVPIAVGVFAVGLGVGLTVAMLLHKGGGKIGRERREL